MQKVNDVIQQLAWETWHRSSRSDVISSVLLAEPRQSEFPERPFTVVRFSLTCEKTPLQLHLMASPLTGSTIIVTVLDVLI